MYSEVLKIVYLTQIEEDGMLLNSFYEASIILIPSLDKPLQEKKITG